MVKRCWQQWCDNVYHSKFQSSQKQTKATRTTDRRTLVGRLLNDNYTPKIFRRSNKHYRRLAFQEKVKMTLLKTFWTPIVVYPDVKTGCKFVAAYTIAISIFLMALIVHMQNGGESTQMYSPFFETNLQDLNLYVVLSLMFFAYMVASSLLLLKGLKNNLRGFLLPWLIGMGFVVIFLLLWSIWLLYGYYIYIHMICAAVIYWVVASMQFYCWLCVYTQYRVIHEMQSPNIELLIF